MADPRTDIASTCVACGYRHSHLEMPVGSRALLRCAACGLVRLHPVPTTDELRAIYDSGVYYTTAPPEPRRGLVAWLQAAVLQAFWGYPGPLGAPGRIAARVMLWPLRSRVLPVAYPADDPVLDVGCGNGQRLLELQRAGCTRLFGVEPTASAAEQARRATRADIRAVPLEEAGLPRSTFGLVILNQVLEHLPSPLGALALIRDHLRPGGRLYLTVPNYGCAESRFFGPSWDGLQLPEHLHHFSAPVLRRLIEESGFRILLLRTDSVWSVTRSSLMAWRQSGPRGWRALLTRLPGPVWWLLTLLADGTGHGQILRVVAVKEMERAV